VDAERERLALDTFETLVELPADARAQNLDALARTDSDLAARVRALLAAEAESERLPTDPDRSPARPPPERIGPYRLLEMIGRGGMGDVYRARRDDGQFEQIVAIKILGSALAGALARDRILFERQALARLIHPNIGRLYDGGETADGVLYFVMELITGEDFVAYAARHDLSVPDILDAFVDLCGAVQFAHQQLLVHGDIKPANVLVTSEGIVKLLDFGVSRYVAQEAGPPGTSPLTRLYAAPELLGGGPASIASDVFSLGLLLGESLTEMVPRRDEGPAASPSTRQNGVGAVPHE
jgi:serine/threonine protein kinase